jgi:hypothetical protein
MVNFLYNPWVIGIGVTVIGGLILHHFFGVGKSQKVIEQKGGRGENSADSSVQEIQKQKFEENKRNYSDPRNSNK